MLDADGLKKVCVWFVHVRVEDVEDCVDDVGDEVDVALPAATSRVHTEGLLHCEAQEQQFGVVNVELVGGLPLPCALLQICVVPAEGTRTQTLNKRRQTSSTTF